MVGKTGNTIPMAPSVRVIVPAIKKSALTMLLLLVLVGTSGFCGMFEKKRVNGIKTLTNFKK